MDKVSELDALVTVALGQPATSHSLLKHPLWTWIDALRSALLLTSAFDRGGAKRAEHELSHLQQRLTHWDTVPREMRLVSARRDAMILKAFIHLILGDRLCFADSFGICAGLKRLGYACWISIGYQYIAQVIESSMHAYVVYENEPVSDAVEVQFAFVEMLTYGQGEGR
jgi:hypothetical protein